MHRLLPIALAMLAVALPTPTAASAASSPHCTIVAGPKHIVVRGTAHADVICATRGRHIIYAEGGNDTITTGPGNDIIYAGPGNDIVHSGAGNDHVYGGPGRDTIDGGNGADVLSGGDGADVLNGGAGNDRLYGTPGADTIDGDAGNDHLLGGAGNDVLTGGPGDDVLDGGAGGDTLDAGPGDTCAGDGGADTLGKWCDHEPPQLVSMSLSATTIDTSQAEAEITVTARITDDLTGLANGLVEVPGLYGAGANFDAADRISGTALDGVYQVTLYVQHYALPGTYPVQVSLDDLVGNHRTLTSADLAAAGLPAEIDQVGAGDAQGPQLLAASLSTSSIDTSTSPQTVHIAMHVTDDMSGVDDVAVLLVSADGQHTLEAYASGVPPDRVSGTDLDGEYDAQVTFPVGSAQGVWTVQKFMLTDYAGNVTTGDADALAAVAGGPVEIDQTGASDDTPPVLESMQISPDPIDDTDGPVTVWLTAHVSDDLSGAVLVDCRLRSPNGRQMFDITAGLRLGDPPVLDGVLTGAGVVDANSAQPGVWTGGCNVQDAVGNVSADTPASVTFL